MFCGKCGALIEDNQQYCPKCGAAVNLNRTNDNPATDRMPPMPAKKGFASKKLWIIIGAVAVIAIAAILLFGNSKVSKSQIDSDLEAYFSDSMGEFTWDGIDITKRQTNKSDRFDAIYLEWSAHNDVCSIDNTAKVTYVLYNDGWRLENVDSQRTNTTILSSSITSDMAKNELENSSLVADDEGGEIEEIDHTLDLESGTESFVYTYTIEYYYCTMQYTARVNYEFGNTDWYFENVDWDEGVIEWDIEGEWMCRTNDAQVWLNVLSFSDDSGEVEYSVKYNYSSGVHTAKSSEPVQVCGEFHNPSSGAPYIVIDLEGADDDYDGDDPGYLTLYPSMMEWDASSAESDLLYFEMLPSDSVSNNVNLSELFVTDSEYLHYWPLDITDPDGKTYDSFYEFESTYGWLLGEKIDTYGVFELDGNYSNFSGTFFCKEDMPKDMAISLFIYADDECVFSCKDLEVGDGIKTFDVDISGAKEMKIMAVSEDEDNDWDETSPTIIIVDASVS